VFNSFTLPGRTPSTIGKYQTPYQFKHHQHQIRRFDSISSIGSAKDLISSRGHFRSLRNERRQQRKLEQAGGYGYGKGRSVSAYDSRSRNSVPNRNQAAQPPDSLLVAGTKTFAFLVASGITTASAFAIINEIVSASKKTASAGDTKLLEELAKVQAMSQQLFANQKTINDDVLKFNSYLTHQATTKVGVGGVPPTVTPEQEQKLARMLGVSLPKREVDLSVMYDDSDPISSPSSEERYDPAVFA
jgi:hypothetical protein